MGKKSYFKIIDTNRIIQRQNRKLKHNKKLDLLGKNYLNRQMISNIDHEILSQINICILFLYITYIINMLNIKINIKYFLYFV